MMLVTWRQFTVFDKQQLDLSSPERHLFGFLSWSGHRSKQGRTFSVLQLVMSLQDFRSPGPVQIARFYIGNRRWGADNGWGRTLNTFFPHWGAVSRGPGCRTSSSFSIQPLWYNIWYCYLILLQGLCFIRSKLCFIPVPKLKVCFWMCETLTWDPGEGTLFMCS